MRGGDLYRIITPTAVFGAEVVDGIVKHVAPYGKKMLVGKTVKEAQDFCWQRRWLFELVRIQPHGGETVKLVKEEVTKQPEAATGNDSDQQEERKPESSAPVAAGIEAHSRKRRTRGSPKQSSEETLGSVQPGEGDAGSDSNGT